MAKATWKSKLGQARADRPGRSHTITEFEQVVREIQAHPDQYLRSTRLREWARPQQELQVHPRASFGSLGL